MGSCAVEHAPGSEGRTAEDCGEDAVLLTAADCREP